MPQNSPAPILSEQSLLLITLGALGVSAIALVGAAIVVRAPPNLGRIIVGSDSLHLVTVLAVSFAVGLLSTERIITGEAAASILSGLIGTS